MRIAWVCGVVFPFVMTPAACSDSGKNAAATCTPGKAEACTCVDGSSGAQTCLSNGTFGACECPITDAGKDATPDSSPDATADAGSDTGPNDGADDAPEAGDASIGCATTCGAGLNESCCATLSVVGGTFNRSNDSSYPATVSDFKLDKFEITVGRFRAFLDAGYGTQAQPPAPNTGAHPKVPNSGWDAAWNGSLAPNTPTATAQLKCTTPQDAATWTDSPGANEDKPISCVTWYEVFAFCIWDDGRLPTEAEWNYAAAGGNEQRDYPWGSTAPTPAYAVFGGAPLEVVGAKSPTGDGRWGHSDLAGSVWEWNLDLATTYVVPCVDCANITTGTERGLRGGSWYDTATLVTSYRHSQVPNFRDTGVGARCARDQ